MNNSDNSATTSDDGDVDWIDFSAFSPKDYQKYNAMCDYYENLLKQNVKYFERTLIIHRRRYEQRRKRRQQQLRNFYARFIHEMEANLIESVLPLILQAVHTIKKETKIEKIPTLIIPKFCFYTNALLHYNEHEWLNAFRLTKETFRWLCKQLRENFIVKFDKLCLEKSIALALYTLASGENCANISALYGVTQSYVQEILKIFLQEVVSKLSNYLLTMPRDKKEIKDIRQGFKRLSNMPELVVGILGMTRVPSYTVPSDSYQFYNTDMKKDHILIHTLVDDRLLFRTVDLVGREPCLFLDSFNEITDLKSVNINGEDLYHAIVVPTGTYPLRPWILKSYDEPANPYEFDFNEAIEQLLAVHQLAQRRLFARWHILRRTNIGISINPGNIATVCFMLHNLLEENEEEYLEEWEDKYEIPIAKWNQSKETDDTVAIEIRDFLAKTISSTEM